MREGWHGINLCVEMGVRGGGGVGRETERQREEEEEEI